MVDSVATDGSFRARLGVYQKAVFDSLGHSPIHTPEGNGRNVLAARLYSLGLNDRSKIISSVKDLRRLGVVCEVGKNGLVTEIYRIDRKPAEGKTTIDGGEEIAIVLPHSPMPAQVAPDIVQQEGHTLQRRVKEADQFALILSELVRLGGRVGADVNAKHFTGLSQTTPSTVNAFLKRMHRLGYIHREVNGRMPVSITVLHGGEEFLQKYGKTILSKVYPPPTSERGGAASLDQQADNGLDSSHIPPSATRFSASPIQNSPNSTDNSESSTFVPESNGASDASTVLTKNDENLVAAFREVIITRRKYNDLADQERLQNEELRAACRAFEKLIDEYRQQNEELRTQNKRLREQNDIYRLREVTQ
jgi:hypothetical protein